MGTTEVSSRWQRVLRAVASGLAFGVLGIVLRFAEDDFEGVPVALQVVLVALAFLSAVAIALAFVVLPASRQFWLGLHGAGRKRWHEVALLALNTAWIWAAMASGFALVSGLLVLHGVAGTAPAHAVHDPFVDSWTYYLWSLLDSIPVLDLPETLGWKQGFRFADPINPLLVLVYKVLVVVPVLETVRLMWRHVLAHGRAPRPSTTGEHRAALPALL